MKTKLILCLTAVATLTGCSCLGPTVAREEQIPYNEAFVYSWKEQLLLNIVRLRYRDDPYFLEVTGLTNNHSLGLSANFEFTFPHVQTFNSQSFSPGISYTEQPVITYVPLQGPDYVKKLLSPIPLKMILALTQSGWSIERVLDICVQEINGVYNAVTAAGPTPECVPEYKQFEYLAHSLRTLQLSNLLVTGEDPNFDPLAHENILDPEKDLYLKILRGRGQDNLVNDVITMLRLDPEVELYKFTTNMLKSDKGSQIKIKPRTLLGVMYYLSQSVQVPQTHVDAGIVTTTHDQYGNPVDWSEIIGEDMQIHYSCCQPQCVAVKVCYRGAWFYIDDSDLNSKSTFMLISTLFNNQTAPGGANTSPPQLTIPLK